MGKGSARPATCSREAGWTAPIPEAVESENRSGDFGRWGRGNTECGMQNVPGSVATSGRAGHGVRPDGGRHRMGVGPCRQQVRQTCSMSTCAPCHGLRLDSVGAASRDPERTLLTTRIGRRGRRSRRSGPVHLVGLAGREALVGFRRSSGCRIYAAGLGDLPGCAPTEFSPGPRLSEVIAGRYHATEPAPRPMESP